METEIARDFLDPWRYNKIEEIAHILGLDSSNEQNLWRDRVFLELNLAIVHSFNQAKVTIVDHQTAAQQFLTHDLREKKAGRECPANWGWIVPPAGGSTCPVYHHEMRDFYLDPHYHHTANKWQVEDQLNLANLLSEVPRERKSQERILILYASETGTAEAFARQAARKLKPYSPQVMALDEYDTQQIPTEKLMLIITSTFGKGEIPANGKNFLQWLKLQAKGSLAGLNYSVMAIGSTVYEKFCAAGVALDKGLTKAGANCIVSLHKGDQIKGQAQTFNQWLGLVTRILGKDTTLTSTDKIDYGIKLQITYLESAPVEPRARVSYDRGVEVIVSKNEELLQEARQGSRSTRHLVFALNHTNLDYETGDHLAVYPHNPAELVNSLAQRLGVNLDAYITATYVDDQGQEIASKKFPFPTPITIRQLLTEELDLLIQEPFVDLLAYLYSVTSNQNERRTLATWLEFLSQGDNTAVCLIQKKHITDHYFTLVDLLTEFPSAQVKLSKLLEILPKQKPRLYSISSSAELYPQQIHLTVGILQITLNTGKTRQGLCSNYLAGLRKGDKVRVSVHKSNFRPPQEQDAIILMVGAGTGISPLIAFLQRRQFLLEQHNDLEKLTKINQSAQSTEQTQQLGQLSPQNSQDLGEKNEEQQLDNTLTLRSEKNYLQGQVYLYFGCRNYQDFLYQEQLKEWLNQAIITELNVAFSRISEAKVYIQNLMENKGQKLWQIISNPKCYYYVCGDAKMAEEVNDLLMLITKKYGGLSHIEAVNLFDKMKKEHRFSTDVWGVTLNYKEAIKQLQKENYNRGEKWLKKLQETEQFSP
jgi:nitric-oxide synthase